MNIYITVEKSEDVARAYELLSKFGIRHGASTNEIVIAPAYRREAIELLKSEGIEFSMR